MYTLYVPCFELIFPETVPTYHSIASSNPVPFIAEVLKIWYLLVLMFVSPRAFATSLTVIAPSMSCLLANTTNTAFFNSSSCKMYKFSLVN